MPWQCVQKIGEDVILVEIVDLPSGAPTCIPSKKHDSRQCGDRPPHGPPPPPPPQPREERDCDGKCEKCMLFDCSRRWGTA